jgi:DNA-binding MarR family transcriptional regulator
VKYMARVDLDRAEREELVTHIIADLRAALAEMRCMGSERLVRQGVSMSQVHVMALVARHGSMPMSRLAELLDVSLSNATGLIDRMEERGLVERVRATDDRRVVTVRLTGSGRNTLDDLELMRDEILRKVLVQLDDTGLRRLADVMDDVGAAVGKAAIDEPSLLAHDHALPAEVAGAPARAAALTTTERT